jgi:predicted ArsR family transcriptional regulator
MAEWEKRLGDVRGDAATRRALAILPEHPILHAQMVAALGVSERAGREALHTLAEHHVVEAFRAKGHDMGRPRH